MNNLVIWGAGGHGRVVADVARAVGITRLVFVDDDPREAALDGIVLAGGANELPALAKDGFTNLVVAIGDNRTRLSCLKRAMDGQFTGAVLVHPTAVVSPSARLGPGTVVMPRAVLNVASVTGAGCIVNTGAIIEHDCRLGDGAHASPGVVLGGGASIGARAHLGLGAVVLPGIEIGDDAVVGAGAVVLRPVPAGATAVGVPARLVGGKGG